MTLLDHVVVETGLGVERGLQALRWAEMRMGSGLLREVLVESPVGRLVAVE